MQHVFPKKVFKQNAEIYRVMGNPTRLHILNYLRYKESTVTQLTKILHLPKANISQHLAILRNLRLVQVRKSGLNSYYRITDARIVEPCRILKELWERKTFA